MGVKIDFKTVNVSEEVPIFDLSNKEIGKLRSATYSPKFKKVIGIAMMLIDQCKISQKFKIKLNGDYASGEICNLPIK